VFRAEAGPDAATVLLVVPVEEVLDGFDDPVPAVDSQDPLRRAWRGVRLVMPKAISSACSPVCVLMDSCSIRTTCPTWGTSRDAVSAVLHQMRRVSVRP
jgi:hypothetical protein